MAPIAIPTAGLPLSEFPNEMTVKKNRIKQGIEVVSIGDETIDQIIQKMRKDSVDVVVSLGKKPVCCSTPRNKPSKLILCRL